MKRLLFCVLLVLLFGCDSFVYVYNLIVKENGKEIINKTYDSFIKVQTSGKSIVVLYFDSTYYREVMSFSTKDDALYEYIIIRSVKDIK